jgi:hypothetical protein
VLARAGYERRRAEGESEGIVYTFPSEFNSLRSLQDQDALPTLIGVVESGIEMARQGSALYLSWLTRAEPSALASKSIDPKLRLEKFLVSIVCPVYEFIQHLLKNQLQYENAGVSSAAVDVWAAATKHSKASYLVWLNYTDTLMYVPFYS